MLYGVAAWYSPTSGRTRYAKRQKTINEFERIQTRAAVLISGAFRNTASVALGIELFLPPVRLHMQQIIEETAIRIQTGPVIAYPGDHVKGTAVSIRAGKVCKKYLGAAADSTVYVVELEGVKMALKWAEAVPITVYSDSQAAIQAVQNPDRPSGQYVLKDIYERIRTLRGRGLQQRDMELRWIPAHIGIEGNERADEAAKRAAIKEIELNSQFRFATSKDEEDEKAPEPSTLLEGLELNEEDDKLAIARIYGEFLNDQPKAVKRWEKIMNLYPSSEDETAIGVVKLGASYELARAYLCNAFDAGVGTPEAVAIAAKLEKLANTQAATDSILSDDDPENDVDGLWDLMTALVAAGDSKNVTVLAHAISNFEKKDPEDDTAWKCDGPCRRSVAKIDRMLLYPICMDTGFCADCLKLLEGETMGIQKCNQKHVKEFLYIPERTKEFNKGKILVDGEIIEFDA
ncbi:ribonuclease H family protein [Aspergillus affinis]|uniref:ribonuclease H family protein n=1 Tax=Aspergillus affinis TaxID=1070780 RepID=UPI0022FEFC36|nr:uncharacterized protein KD926_002794 [Aspergillus affinis]KAI9043903.1 hypothetical protein KD926_002794 [Aspergillus affinis]